MMYKYLSDVIEDTDILKMIGRKTIIVAPTGSGKTTFLLKRLIPFLLAYKKGKFSAPRKVLILVNRKMLRQQYFQSCLKKFRTYQEFADSIEILTYQAFYTQCNRFINKSKAFEGYCAVICDECHYFYQDSDYNSKATTRLLRIILEEEYLGTVIFTTATGHECVSILEREWNFVRANHRCTDKNYAVGEYAIANMELLKYLSVISEDFSRYKCEYVETFEALVDIICHSAGKTIVFVDEKAKGNELKNQMITVLKSKDIKKTVKLLHADNIDDDNADKVVEGMIVTRKLPVDILITTAVLDNGVSIEDSDVDCVVIITDTEVNFLQMLGRVRNIDDGVIHLIFVKRFPEEFSNRITSLKKTVEIAEMLENDIVKGGKSFSGKRLLSEMCEADTELADVYKKILMLNVNDAKYLNCFERYKRYYVTNERDEDFCLTLNTIAIDKIKEQFWMNSKLKQAAETDPLEAIYLQMEWIGKDKSELMKADDKYYEKIRAEFKDRLLKVQDYSCNQLKEFKSETKPYVKKLFPDINLRGGNDSYGNDTFKRVLERLNLRLTEGINPNDKKKIYSVVEVLMNERTKEEEYD